MSLLLIQLLIHKIYISQNNKTNSFSKQKKGLLAEASKPYI